MARLSADTLSSNITGNGKLRRSDRFLSGLATAQRVVFLSHVQPDPDSLGSMLGLAHLVETKLGKPTLLTQDGNVNRAENRAMIDLLDLELSPLKDWKAAPGDSCVMVDSQPGTGRHNCGRLTNLYAVLDHHVTPGELDGIPYIDIRPDLGATCTLVTRYLVEQRVEIPEKVATALLYGIETELGGYPREGSPSDDEAVQTLYPFADKDILARIRNARLPQSHFDCLSRALQNAVILDRLVFTWVDPLALPEQAAEVVDFLIRHDQLDWAICAGVHGNQVVLSVRASKANAGAGQRLRQVVAGDGNAGGHERRAGGSIVLTDRSPEALQALRQTLVERIRKVFALEFASQQPLIALR
jgi:nanoRNase/pAp phosphatase (c-di-AMP/oligoRNAs hydrolase)